MSKEQEQPLDISCIDLDLLRAQVKENGGVILSNQRPMTVARSTILESINPGGQIILLDPKESLEVSYVSDPFHQRMILEARDEALFSDCWWRKVGCVAGFPDSESVVLRTHNELPPGGNYCKNLEIDQTEVIGLLSKGERLEFCPARHAENVMAPKILRMREDAQNLDIAISLEPCDHCAYLLKDLNPKGVYIDFSPQKKYYSSLGIRILQSADVPVYFVRMEEEDGA